MSWRFEADTPVYIQIERRICADILRGKYAPGAQIPSVRQIAMEAAVNPNTVQKALIELEGRGIVSAQSTVGRFVTLDSKIIENERRLVLKEITDRFLKSALALGISKQELIKQLGEEDA